MRFADEYRNVAGQGPFINYVNWVVAQISGLTQGGGYIKISLCESLSYKREGLLLDNVIKLITRSGVMVRGVEKVSK